MRYCNYVQRLCPRLVLSQSVTFDGTSVVINIPAGSYDNGCQYCIVIAQPIPLTATIAAPVVITIGNGTVQYPLTNRCCAAVTACGIRTRAKYAVVVSTSATGGTFKMLGAPACSPSFALASIDGTVPAAAAAEGGGAA